VNYKCPLTTGLCDSLCRFYSDEPQKQSEDPDGPGSCVFVHACRRIVDLDNDVHDVTKIITRAAAKYGFGI